MEVTTKSRAELKARFVKNSIPTETDFANLIDGLFNLQDDGVVKSAGNPLSIQADGESSGPQKVLNLYSSLKDANPAWTLSLNPRSDPANANSARSGFNLSTGGSEGASRFFIDRASGNVGVGTITPGAKLEVNGTLTANGATALHGAVTIGSAQTPQPLTVSGATTLTGNVGIGSSPAQALHVAVAKSVRFELGSGQKLSLGGNGALEVDAPGVVAGRFVVTDGGNVGIGTADPGTYKLKVQSGDTYLGGGLTTTGATNLNGTVSIGSTQTPQPMTVTGATMLTGNVSVGTASSISFGNAVRQMINLWSTGYGIGVQNSTQYFRTDKNFAWYKGGSHHDSELNAGTSGTAQMVIKDGNVGIGTTDPGNYKLKVQSGDTYLGGGLTVSGAITPSAGSATTNGIMFPTDPFGGGGDAAWIRYHNTRGGERGTLEIGIANDGDDHIVLLSSGNVGIGTTDPQSKLDVAGPILERLELIQCNRRDDWTAQNHPIMLYFKTKLQGKSVGTMVRAIQDHPSWRGHYWQGWVDADGRIRVIHNYHNTTAVVV